MFDTVLYTIHPLIDQYNRRLDPNKKLGTNSTDRIALPRHNVGHNYRCKKKKNSDFAGGVGHSFGWVAILEGEVNRYKNHDPERAQRESNTQ